MALPPSIPTSFVPRPESLSAKRPSRLDLTGAFNFIALIIFVIAMVGAIGMFAYGRYLAVQLAADNAALAKAEASIDPGTAQSFVDLSGQLSSAEGLLASHVLYTPFFNLLDDLTPSTISFSSLTLSTNPDDSAALSMTGTAADFNSLAFESEQIATNADIQNAIFSNIAIEKNGTIGFSLAATLTPALVQIPAAGAPGAVPAEQQPVVTASSSTP